MKIIRILELSGPNVWTNRHSIEAWVDLGSWEERPSNVIPGFYERLTGWLPALIEHRCTIGERGGFLQRLQTGTWLGHVLEHVTLELQTVVHAPVGYGRARETPDYAMYRVVIAAHEPRFGLAALEVGRRLVLAAAEDKPFDLTAELSHLRAKAKEFGLTLAGHLIASAARERELPVRRFGTSQIYFIGHGVDQRRVRETDTDRGDALGAAIVAEPPLARSLLRQVGIPVLAEGERSSAPFHQVWVIGERVVAALTDYQAGTPRRVLENVPPDVSQLCVLTARTLGLHVAAVELLGDLGSSRGAQTIQVVNAAPSFSLELCAALDRARAEAVAGLLVEDLVPLDAVAKFRLVAVAGTNGKSEVVLRLRAAVAAAGKRLAVAEHVSPPIWDGQIAPHPRGDGAVVRALSNPNVEVALVELSEQGILEEALPFDDCDIAIVTDLGAGDHLGRRYLQDVSFSRKAIRTPVDVVRPQGYAVLSADDAEVRDLAQYCPGKVVFFTAESPSLELWEKAGEQATIVYLSAGWVKAATRAGDQGLLQISDALLPASPEELRNCLAATAAGWLLGVSPVALLQIWSEAAGATRYFSLRGRAVALSNCRNRSALDATVRTLALSYPKGVDLVLSPDADWRISDAQVIGADCARHAWVALANAAPASEPMASVVRALVGAAELAGRGFNRFGAAADALDAWLQADAAEALLVQTLSREQTLELAQLLEAKGAFRQEPPRGRSQSARR